MEEVTLLFRHLPLELSMEERKDLLHYLGAKRVQVMPGKGRMKNTAFAVFESKEKALKVIKEINEVEFMGSKLKVEFAHRNQSCLRVTSVVDNEGMENKEDPDEGSNKKDEVKEKPVMKEIKFDETFQTWGLNHQRRPDLCYLYPPPTPSTLTNIMHTLAAVPKFYVQVLHLMNKMDLPAPFGALTAAPSMYQDMGGYVVTDDAVQQEMDISSSAESELESDEDQKQIRPKEQEQVKRLLKKKADHQRKRPRLTDLKDVFMPQPDIPTAEAPSLTEVFDQALSEHVATARKIELKISSTKQTPTTTVQHARASPPSPPSPSGPGPAPAPAIYPDTVEDQSQTSALTWTHQDKTSSDPHQTSLPTEQQNFLTVTAGEQLERLQHLQSLMPGTQYESNVRDDTTAPLPNLDHRNLYDVPLPPQQTQQQLTEHSMVHPNQHHQQEVVVDSASGIETTQDQRETSSVGGFGILQPQQPTQHESDGEEEMSEKEWTKFEFISSSQLKKSRLSHSEMKDYSVFRRYNQGDPSCRLYIKNLSKQVTEQDIHWIFGRYVDWDNPSEKLRFDIRLMKEGRMKGQAFVALPSEEAASSAVKDTNGFLLKEKPMVVQFARSAKAQEGHSSSKPK